ELNLKLSLYDCMSHEPKSPSLGMISAAPCSMATVSPLAPSPISGAVVANGSPAAQSAHSGFAAALRKLAKQAEEPRGSISSESLHVSSPVTNHISPVSTPKRVAMGTSLGPPTGTPPVVTIAPTKTVNGFWRSEGRQVRQSLWSGQERLAPDRPLPGQEKPSLSLSVHLSRQVPHMLLSGAQDEFVRDGFRPYASADELRVPLRLPLGLSPGTAADALAYFHSGYLPHPSLASYRCVMEDYYSLSALRSHYYPHPEGATLPALHPSAVHLPMPGVFYPPDITHQSLSALHSERLQMEEELRQQQRERMREIERERQWEQEVQREKDREREKQRELEMTKERGRDVQAVKAVEKRHLSHEPPANTHSISQPHPYTHRQPARERGKLEERLAANREDVRWVSGLSQQRPASSQSDSRPPQGPALDRTDPMMVYDQALQQHRRLVSKLDLEEKKRREAREKGYYYELDDSYDESDEEEVRTHLRRVTQQPPLKLDASTEKTEFLCLFGLTTLSKRDKLLEMKKRKRRMMLQERVPSPSAVPNKRKTLSPPHPPLCTRFTPEEMDRTEELDDKKHFLSIFSLSHVSKEERQKNKKIVDMLEAIKQKTVTLDTLRNATDTPCSSPAASSVSNVHPEPQNHSPENHHPPLDPPPLAPLHAQGQPNLTSLSRRGPSLQASAPQPLARPKDPPPKLPVWERINSEEFAQHFHQSVLQSTQISQQTQKGGASEQFEPPALPPPGLQRAVNRLPNGQSNGHSCHISAQRESPGVRNDFSAEEGVSSDEDEEESSFGPRWRGIESIFEAYEEYMEEKSIEQQVLQSECRRLETQHYNLTHTAEQLSHSMRDLLAQKHNLALKRDHMQAELEHIKECLTLPLLHWHRGYYKRPSPR
uniref:Genetic suppressor element 1-like n=1 Tax=Sinocyclocheilus grahami TaxID=75366 RepID=A0A672S1G4_SINGR